MTFEHLTTNLATIRERITAAGGVDVDILPVTKGFDGSAIVAAVGAGFDAIGENYVQELLAKLAAIRSGDVAGADTVPANLQIQMIGQLQTNKVRQLAGVATCYASVDRSKLAREIAKRDPGAAVLIQVDTSDEPGKGGVPLAEVDALVDAVGELGLDLRGCLTVGPTGGGPEAARPGFAAVRAIVDRHRFDVCSMGMSDDLEVAVSEGSTQVRVGSALFGPRPGPR